MRSHARGPLPSAPASRRRPSRRSSTTCPCPCSRSPDRRRCAWSTPMPRCAGRHPAPRPGEELASAVPAFVGDPGLGVLREAFTGAGGAVEFEHPAWDGDPRRRARSAVFRLPAEPDSWPLVALLGLGGEGQQAVRTELAALRRELEDLRRREERHSRWLDGVAALAAGFQREPGPRVVEDGLDVVIRQTNAVDGGLARYVSGRLELPGTRRGLLGRSSLTVAAHPDVAAALRDAQ